MVRSHPLSALQAVCNQTRYYLDEDQMSNTFDGIIREFPFLCVDRFNSSACVFLLTHCHSDHLLGILNKSFTGPVYCSFETKELLKISRVNSKFLSLIKTIEYNVPTCLEVPQSVENVYGKVYISLIKAYHCVGACMFLIENENGSVLITGDIRAEKWWCNKLQNVPSLFPYISGLRTLDSIYFDATFGYRGEPYIEIPPNNSGIHTAINILKDFPKDDPEICFMFLDTILGFELAWAFILSFFRASLRIEDKKLLDLISSAANFDKINGPSLLLAIEKGKSKHHNRHGVFYAASRGFKHTENVPVFVKIKQCINFNIMDFAGVFCPLRLDSMSLQERRTLTMVHETQRGNKVYLVRGRSWILPKNGRELLPLNVKLVFSRHSSYSETRSFISIFRPRQVFPCWHSKEAWLNGFGMNRLFGELCSGDIFCFDTNMLSQYGVPMKEIMTRKVSTINRWDVNSCKEEEIFIKDTLQETKKLKDQGLSNRSIALINLRRVVRVPIFKKDRTAEDQDFMLKKTKDFTFQKIVEGRREVSYRKFIEEQQQLYYKRNNLPQFKRDYESVKYLRQFSSTLGGSSDYDTDSCSSSLDLTAIATGNTPPIEFSSQDSETVESQTNDDVEIPRGLRIANLTRRRHYRPKNSFVRSSFGSFEESIASKRIHRCLTEPVFC